MEQQELFDLLEKSKAGDRRAQEKLVAETQNRVYYHCKKMLKNEDDALDATQDVLIAMLTGLDNLREPAAFWGWVNGITANRCKHLLTQGTKEWQIPEDEEGNSLLDGIEDLDEQVVPDKVMDNSETRRLILEIIDALPPEQKMTVLFYYYDEMPVKEIAAAMEVSEGTVKSRLNYARKAIKEGVEKLEKKGTKLYGVSPLPFLAYFLRQSMAAESLSPAMAGTMTQGVMATAGAAGTAGATAGTAAGAAAATGTASSASAGGAAAAAGAAAKGVVGSKIALGLAGLAVAGTVAGGVALSSRPAPPEPASTAAMTVATALAAAAEATPEPTPVPELPTKYREDYENGEFLEVYVTEEGVVYFGSLIYTDTGETFMAVSAGGEMNITRGISGSAGYAQITVTESADLTLKCYDNDDEAQAGYGDSERTFQNAAVRVVANDGAFWLETVSVPGSVSTPEPTTTEDPDFIIRDGALIEYNGPGGDVVIPEGVTSIRISAFHTYDGIINVPLSDGRPRYGVYPVSTNLTSVTLPSSMTEITIRAFEGHTNLTNVTIPDSVTRIGPQAFANCTGLTSITLPDSVTYISEHAFANTGLTSITISDKMTQLSEWSFINCTNLTSATILGDTTVFGSGVFDLCPNLTIYAHTGSSAEKYANSNRIPFVALDASESAENEFVIENGTLVKYKGPGGDVVIPDGVSAIGKNAFSACQTLTSVIFPDSVTSIENQAFWSCHSLTSINLPNALTSIGNDAFSNCKALTDLTIPGSVTTIGERAFSSCESLTSVTIPDSVTSLGASAFSRCTNLRNVIIGKGLTEINAATFYACASLTEITIPANVSRMSSNVFFDGAYNLTSVTILNPSVSFESTFHKASQMNPKLTLYAPAGSTTETYANNNSIPFVALDAPEPTPTADPDFTIDEYGTLVKYNGPGGDVVVPDGVSAIGKNAFSVCQTLTSVILPDSVTSIEDQAFWSCYSLTSINLPNTLTSIGNDAFSHCKALTDLTIPGSVTTIGEDAFLSCESLTSVTIPDSVTSLGTLAFGDCTNLQNVIIGKGLTEINSATFTACASLTEITIPANVSRMGSNVFNGAYNLTSVTILNPSFSLDSTFYKVSQMNPKLTLYAPAGSTTETYANNNSIPFVPI